MKPYFAYIRVSTQKQGDKGVSLAEQKDSIERFAERHSAKITHWFEERETAAKSGRRVFSDMLNRLRKKQADGVIIHKIDRSARNLRDWADMGDLIDAGVDVLIASEGFDLASRGGRLSADIQAVVAADFIRNLREETRKGFYGRLKQGLYPLPAPLGYLDNGGGEPKTPDPNRAPLIQMAFEQYAEGRFSLRALREELAALGLTSRSGDVVSLNGLSVILNNPFYAGLIRIYATGETFNGVHEPLISMELFNTVQRRLGAKRNLGPVRHNYLFRRLVQCGNCGKSLVGEKQKGRIYYRCHTTDCHVTTIREDRLEKSFKRFLQGFEAPVEIHADINEVLKNPDQYWSRAIRRQTTALRLNLANDKKRLDRLTDAFVDGSIDKDAFNERRLSLLTTIKRTEQKCDELERQFTSNKATLLKELELWKSLCSSYNSADRVGKRKLIEIVTSNRTYDGKNVSIEPRTPFLDFKKALLSPRAAHLGTELEPF